MNRRLAEPFGQRIDRNTTVSFDFDGKRYQGFAGDTLAGALAANGEYLMSRSFKYHRPRGILTMTGEDTGTMVTVNDVPNCFGGDYQISDGDHIRSQNHLGSLRRDFASIISVFARFLPVGFYYKAFYKPSGVWQWWSKFFRKSAGLGRIDTSFKPQRMTKRFEHVDHLIIGGGFHGMQMALSAACEGKDTLLVEAESELGGSLNYCRLDAQGEKARLMKDDLVSQIASNTAIRVITSAKCNGWFSDHLVPVISGNQMIKIRAEEVTLATGAMEQPAVFRNNDLPGIMLASAVQRLIHLSGVAPGKRAVVLTANNEGYGCALDLLDTGSEVIIVELRKDKPESALVAALEEKGVTIIQGQEPHEAVGKHHRVSFLQLRRATEPSLQAGAVELSDGIECDLICISVGFMPNYQIPCQAGGSLVFDETNASFQLTNLPKGLDLAGAVSGSWGLEDREFACNYPWPIFPHAKQKEFVDLDEDLQISDIVNAVAEGFEHIQLVKRFSTIGMGPSQGRHSALNTARIVAETLGTSIQATGVTTARPPVAAEPLGIAAGEAYFPSKYTSMHQSHEALNAEFLLAGTWRRPAFYPRQGEQPWQSVQREALNVRNNVGIIDVSTLGGLDLKGPDAAEFLNRLYTSGFKSLAVGRSKYALMCNEAGVVIDDGVVAKLGEEHYYVTATTTGVDNVYRQMLRWNLQWQLEVDIANVTSALCAVNVAGPNAALVVSKLTSLSLAEDDFPYLGVRQADVAGIPARLLRVGFVGELGYEIHVPQTYGASLWSAIMEAGAELDIAPFGVEAQRLLRLEKGHIIIGQDSDAMSNPCELELKWAISSKKAFFVGDRSLREFESKPLQRRLAGFCVKGSHPPDEANLVVDGEKMTGRVTSAAYSPTLDCVIGLAYVPAALEIGAAISIKIDGGDLLQAELVAHPFYDPAGKRQEIGDRVAAQKLIQRRAKSSSQVVVTESDLEMLDLTLSARIGVRGKHAAAALKSAGLPVPVNPNQAQRLPEGMVLRLSQNEFMVMRDDLNPIDQFREAVGVYLLPRDQSHARFRLSGDSSLALLKTVCAVDLREKYFANNQIAQTQIFGISVILVRLQQDSFELLCDMSNSRYFYDSIMSSRR